MSGHDWRNWETCQCREPGCRSYRVGRSPATTSWDDTPWSKPVAPKPVDLDGAQALADAASGGPWVVRETADGEILIDYGDGYTVGGTNISEDAEFIAQARTLLPALIAELRAARLNVAGEREVSERHMDRFTAAEAKLAIAEATAKGSEMSAKWNLAKVQRVQALADLWEMEAVEQEDRDIVTIIRAALEGGE